MEFTSYKRLREVREALHLSQNEIAALLKTTRQQIGKWENGVQ
ncbi:MAG: helix-turn-helix transcriptional regulator, partial [Clostridia bacterium]|nr:helix-turn-helix transcriptional regulator [Clostridia bacterium]